MVLYEWRQIFKLTQTHSLNFSELENTFFGKVTLTHTKESSEFLGVFSFHPKLLTQKGWLMQTACDYQSKDINQHTDGLHFAKRGTKAKV